jgi:hypothetical protein
MEKNLMLFKIETLVSDNKKIQGVINIKNFIKRVMSGGLE